MRKHYADHLQSESAREAIQGASTDGVDNVNVENNLVLREILQASPVDMMQASQRFRFSEC